MEGTLENEAEGRKTKKFLAATLVFLFLTGMLMVLFQLSKWSAAGFSNGTIETVGRALFHEYLLPFELISLLLLVGVIGVIRITQQKESV